MFGCLLPNMQRKGFVQCASRALRALGHQMFYVQVAPAALRAPRPNKGTGKNYWNKFSTTSFSLYEFPVDEVKPLCDSQEGFTTDSNQGSVGSSPRPDTTSRNGDSSLVEGWAQMCWSREWASGSQGRGEGFEIERNTIQIIVVSHSPYLILMVLCIHIKNLGFETPWICEELTVNPKIWRISFYTVYTPVHTHIRPMICTPSSQVPL
jgi:hypothetical protein